MKKILIIISKVIGVGFMILAFLQWLTFDNPDVNPFWPGAIFAPGMLSQVVNWLIVCVIGAVGLMFFKIEEFIGKDVESKGSE